MGPRLHHVVYICRCLYIYTYIFIYICICILIIYIYDYICICYHLITGMNHVSTMDNKIRHCNDSICASHFFFNHVMCCCSLYGDFFKWGITKKMGFNLNIKPWSSITWIILGIPMTLGALPTSPQPPNIVGRCWRKKHTKSTISNHPKTPEHISLNHQIFAV